MNPIEYHPFKPFIPIEPKILILGSFPGKEQTQADFQQKWFYGSSRNQFWKILEGVYQIPLHQKAQQQQLFENQGIAITDIIYSARRIDNSNLDNNLEIVSYNRSVIDDILNNNQFEKILFTSRFVELHFYKKLKFTSLGICLPSPSPRFARLSLQQKIDVYKRHLLF
jgi:hypoxanthine-DNA glycosylase